MKILIYTTITCLLLCNCNSESSSDSNNLGNSNNRISVGGNSVYGGVLNISEEESFSSIFPGEIIDAISAKIDSKRNPMWRSKSAKIHRCHHCEIKYCRPNEIKY